MTTSVRTAIRTLIVGKIEEKLANYSAETEYMPFFEAIFDKQTMVLASVMQSLYTSFGMSIYEQIACILARAAGHTAERQYILEGSIDDSTELLIQRLCLTPNPDKTQDLERIRESIKPGKRVRDSDSCVDVYVRKSNGHELFVDITTVKPNLKEFKTLRVKMLRWAAMRFSQRRDAVVQTCIGIPYNPYYPKTYQRWTAGGCAPGDVLVQNDLWSAFADYDAFPEILVAFEEAGVELQTKVKSFLHRIR